jgi:hypothetical protein
MLDASMGLSSLTYKNVYWSGGVLLAVLLGVGAVTLQDDPPSEPPYSLWRSGKLIKIRNCERPASEEDVLLCASLYCEQAVSMKMVTPQQSTITTETRQRLSESRQIRISGNLKYYQIRSRSLPYGYQCTMDRYNRAEPELLFRSRPG